MISRSGNVLSLLVAIILCCQLACAKDGNAVLAKKDKTVLKNSIGMKLVLIPAGKFTIGSPKGEEGRYENETEHEVEITRQYYMGTYTVTQEEYEQVMDEAPSYFSNTGVGKVAVRGMDIRRFPVERVSWDDAVKFCKKLTAMEKKLGIARKHRLPTEAEWEYACREAGKSKSTFCFGSKLSSGLVNFNGHFPYGNAAKGDYLRRTTKVGSYKPNKLGLYDMHGNVYQWCSDWYAEDYYTNSDRKDPRGPKNGKVRVLRGGSWCSIGRNCRAAYRYNFGPAYRDGNIGFRVVCAVAPRTR